jgi:hypothetical protein
MIGFHIDLFGVPAPRIGLVYPYVSSTGTRLTSILPNGSLGRDVIRVEVNQRVDDEVEVVCGLRIRRERTDLVRGPMQRDML